MTSIIQRIGKLAVKLFKREPNKSKLYDLNKTDTEELKSMLNILTANDLKLDPNLLNGRSVYKPPPHREAPVTYMQIYQDSDVNICVFFLKSGTKLPLHDHPDMIGLLKVVHGKIKIQSYSVKKDDKEIIKLNGFENVCQAIKHPLETVSHTDDVCVLHPGIHNIHEISSVDGPAAFLDILSPPYGKDARTNKERDCNYYKELKLKKDDTNSDSKYVYLLTVDSPGDFWCDQAEYGGPPVGDF